MAIQFQTPPLQNPYEYLFNRLDAIQLEQREIKELISSLLPGSESKDLSRNQASDELQISLKTLNTLLRTGQLEYYNIGRSVRIPKAAIEKFKETQKSC